MSEQVTVSVKLVKLTQEARSEVDQDISILNEYDVEEYLYVNDLYKVGDDLWEVKEDQHLETSDFINVSKLTDDEIHFTASYYNGGCSFNEVLEAAFRKGVK